MLYRFAVKELKAGALQRRYGYSVIVMQYYPRFVKKELVDEYLRTLAPERELFSEFKALDRELGDHDLAFEKVHYEERFSLSTAGDEDLRRLSELSATQDVYLFCQCEATEHCHADLLLLAARHRHSAAIAWMRVKYPVYEARLRAEGR